MNGEEYIKKWLSDDLSEEERKEFEQTEEYKNLKTLDDAVKAFKAPAYDPKIEYARLSENIEGKQDAKNVVVVWWRPVMRAAAVILLLMVGLLWYFSLEENLTTITTGIAEKETIYLPDSSMVIINAFSTVAYDPDDWEEERTINLKGEAFFKVQAGSRFTVSTDAGQVEVVGTEFNVRERTDLFEVICYEGLVAVRYKDKAYELPAKQIFRAGEGVEDVADISMYSEPHLLVDQSIFRSVPFRQVVEEFERHYDVDLVVKRDLESVMFTGIFPHDDQDLALKSITLPLNLTFKVTDNNRIILTSAE